MNQLVLWNDIRLFYGSNPRAVSEHSHPVIQLVLATHGSFLSKDEEGHWNQKTGLLIAPNYLHECNAKDIPILSIDIDPESILGEWIMDNQLKGKYIIDYPSNKLVALDLDDFSSKLEGGKWKEIRIIIEKIFAFIKIERPSLKDVRIDRILNFITKNIDNHIDTYMLMEVAHLSESRLLHIFKEIMGLPIRNYILWYRLKIAFTTLIEGRSLTEAAYQAGFSDQAHMTRTCVKMMGIPPSVLTKNSKFVQVSFPQ